MKQQKNYLTGVNIYKLRSPTQSSRPARKKPSVKCRTRTQTDMFGAEQQWTPSCERYLFPPKCHLRSSGDNSIFFFSSSFSLTPPSLPLKLMKRNDQKCSETNGEPLFWSFDLWDWKVLHKEQMMTVPTVVLYIIIIPYQLFLFKAATCAVCPYFVPATVHGKAKKKRKKREGVCVLWHDLCMQTVQIKSPAPLINMANEILCMAFS